MSPEARGQPGRLIFKDHRADREFDLGGAGFPNFTVNRTSNPGVVWIANADNVMVRIMWGYGRCSARLLPNYHNQFNDWAFDWTQAGLELPVPQLPGTPIYP